MKCFIFEEFVSLFFNILSSKVKCQLQKVHIQHVQRFHTLDYEAQLCSVISSHCEYSLVTGKSQNVQYDFFGIQKQLINQFINGKPIIIPDIPHVVYRKDVHSIQNFSKIKEQLRPQVCAWEFFFFSSYMCIVSMMGRSSFLLSPSKRFLESLLAYHN